jgi:hypothetical protein
VSLAAPIHRPKLIAAALAGTVLAVVATAAPACAGTGPFSVSNPFTAANGAATMHGDSESSDTSPWPGPGVGEQRVRVVTLAAACPTVLEGSDGIPLALCTAIADRRPTVYEFDPATGEPVASLALPASGNVFGGVYPYLDQHDRIVVFDAAGNLLRIGHHRHGGRAALTVDQSVPVGAALARRCPDACGGVVGSAPDWRGRVWFATAQGVAGVVDPRDGDVRTLLLGDGEQVANSISTTPGATAIATDHALYLLSAAHDGVPKVLWRAVYDRGPARKPGQLSHGTGATPTFFGPEDGTRYLTITDNAAPTEHLLVYDTWARAARRRGAHKVPRLVCKTPVLTPGASGTENSPVGFGRSVFVASTYGYPYPATPAGAEPTQPASADFTGGLTRVDVRSDGTGCDVRWQVPVRSASVPRLDVAEARLYDVDRRGLTGSMTPGPFDTYTSVAIDAATGAVVHRQPIGVGYDADTLQLAPTIVPGRVLYQGTITGLTRISPR